MNFEDDLRRSLGRVDAPEGFANCVMTRLEREQRLQRRQWWVGIAAAALIAVLLPVGIGQYEVQVQVKQRDKAVQDLSKALRITGTKLVKARILLRESSAQPTETRN